jgi:hypothetical protein
MLGPGPDGLAKATPADWPEAAGRADQAEAVPG